MGEREKRIREEAYRLWDAAGRPEADDETFWFQAEQRIAAAEQEPAGDAPPASPVVAARNAGNSGVKPNAVTAPMKGEAVEVGLGKPRPTAKRPAGPAAAPKPARAPATPKDPRPKT